MNFLILTYLILLFELCTACSMGRQEGPLCENIELSSEAVSKLDSDIKMLTLQQVHGRISTEIFKDFGELEDLIFSYSNISEIENGALCSSSNLTHLHFINTTLPKLNKGVFENCKHLSKLFFIFMPAELEIDKDAFVGMESLRHFLFDHGTWTRISVGQLNGLDNLDSLIITNSRLEEIEIDAFDSLKNLTKLSLVGNKISTLKPGTFETLTHLQDMQLYGNNLTKISGEEFSGLESLEILDLITNPISSIDVDSLLEYTPSLKRLYLTRSNIAGDERKMVAEKLKEAGLSKLDY